MGEIERRSRRTESDDYERPTGATLPRGRGGCVIVATRGGASDVGASTVALNLGRELEGVVVDGDLAFAERDSLRGPDFHDVLAGRADPLEAVTDVGSVRLLPCGRSLADAGKHNRVAIESALEAVDREFVHVVVDCPVRTDETVQSLPDGADAALIVTTTAHESLVAAARTRRRALEAETPIGAVVLNRSAPSRPAAEERVRAIERGLGGPVLVLTERTTVRVVGTTGRPVRDVAPDSDAVDRFETLAATLEDGQRPDPVTVP